MRLIHLLPQLVQAAFWFSSPEEAYQHGQFIKFVDAVKDARMMENTPLAGDLVPDWMNQLEDMQVPSEMPQLILNDAKLQESLEYLANSNIEVGQWSQTINDSLREKAKKIAVLLSPSPDHEGLKRYTLQLAENARNYPTWLDYHKVAGIQALGPAVILGLAEARVSNQVQLGHVKALLEGELIFKGIERMQMYTAAEIGCLLDAYLTHGGEIHKGTNIVRRLHQIAASSGLETEALSRLMTMIPTGQRFAIGTVSKTRYTAIVDMIKAEDGLVYGIKYATSDALHAPAIAFIMRHAELPKLIEFLHEAYDLGNDIGQSKVLKWQAVEVNWYPGGQITNPVAMVRGYSLGGYATLNHLKVGTLIEYCRELKQADTSTYVAKLVKLRGDMYQLVRELSPADAKMVSNFISEDWENEKGHSDATSVLAHIKSFLPQ